MEKTTVNVEVVKLSEEAYKAQMEKFKKYFSNKTHGFAVGYLAALGQVNRVSPSVISDEQLEIAKKAAYACGLLNTVKKVNNPLAA